MTDEKIMKKKFDVIDVDGLVLKNGEKN